MKQQIILHSSTVLVAVQVVWTDTEVANITCRLPNQDDGNPFSLQTAVVIYILILVSNQLLHLSWQQLLLCFVSKEIFGSNIATRSCCYYCLANNPNLCSPSKHPSDFEEFGNLIPHWGFTNNPSFYNGPRPKAKSNHAEPSLLNAWWELQLLQCVSNSVICYCCFIMTPSLFICRKMQQTKTNGTPKVSTKTSVISPFSYQTRLLSFFCVNRPKNTCVSFVVRLSHTR